MKIKMFVLSSFPSLVSGKELQDPDEFERLEEKANKNGKLYEFINSIKDESIMKIVEFEAPDDLDKENLSYICQGRAFSIWFDLGVDLFSDFYLTWAFRLLNNKWVSIYEK